MKIKLVPQDFWIGLYWKHDRVIVASGFEIQFTKWYLCLIPCLPICWTTYKLQPQTR